LKVHHRIAAKAGDKQDIIRTGPKEAWGPELNKLSNPEDTQDRRRHAAQPRAPWTFFSRRKHKARVASDVTTVARMIGMCVRDNRARRRLSRINIEIACRTIKAFFSGDDQRVHDEVR